jgi:hypothetical protein
LQKKQAALKLTAQAADGAVEVTVNARGQVVKTVVDKSYLDDHDFEDLGDHITEAAQAAARDAAGRVAKMLAPINERHKKILAETGNRDKAFGLKLVARRQPRLTALRRGSAIRCGTPVGL